MARLSSSQSQSPSPSALHILLFPFMAKGHTIPLLDLAKLIHRHRPTATLTVFTTTANRHFILSSLSSAIPSHLLTIISFPFPSHPAIPPGVESTDMLPSMDFLIPFVEAVSLLQPFFETALHDLHIHHNATVETTCFLVSDMFLYWTQESASKFNMPRLVYYGMSSYTHTLFRTLRGNKAFLEAEVGDDELIEVPEFPGVRLTRNDLGRPFIDPDPKGPHSEFLVKSDTSNSKSYGLLVNSFYEMESKFVDYWNDNFKPKAWTVGPFCLVEKSKTSSFKLEKPAYWMEWLDQRLIEGRHVLYVAFGSQVYISDEQLKEMCVGLENSRVDFLWALRIKPDQEKIMEGFEEKVKNRGLIVRGWIGQREVLEHKSVSGFLSHCGWNSVIESICAGVPILAWPMMADQHVNARMVADEIKVGLRVEMCDGSVRGFVEWEGLSKKVKELMAMDGMGKLVRQKVKELSVVARKAVEEGGTSWDSLELLLHELETTAFVSASPVKDMAAPINAIAPSLQQPQEICLLPTRVMLFGD